MSSTEKVKKEYPTTKTKKNKKNEQATNKTSGPPRASVSIFPPPKKV